MDINSKNKQHLKLRRISTIFRTCRHDDTTTTTTTASHASNKTPSPPNPKPNKPPTLPFPSIHKPNSTTPKFTITRKPDPAREKLSESCTYSSLFLEKQNKCSKKTRRKRREVKKASSFETSSEDDEVGSRSNRRLLKRDHQYHDKAVVVEAEAEAEVKQSDCYAIVKCSKDPYMDFRTSMVEMIVEKRMRKAKDLEWLLQCFLKINSYRHHPIIIEAFMEIWDALFLYSSL